MVLNVLGTRLNTDYIVGYHIVEESKLGLHSDKFILVIEVTNSTGRFPFSFDTCEEANKYAEKLDKYLITHQLK